MPDPAPAPRHLLTAELLSIGTELTVGDTRDTNAGELARGLTALGVRVGRTTALPDDLEAVAGAFRSGLERADLVVSTGGLGPTPDDLTREAIASVCGERPSVDPELEAWLRELWKRRGMPFPELNLKQAWRIPSAEALPNPNGTAPGWFVRRPDGRVVVALPGPPREMRAMWSDQALPRLVAQGLGADVASRTYRLTGIGESMLADRLGDALLRSTNPIIATYARNEAVDVRISARGEPPNSAQALVETAAASVLDLVGEYVWATGDTTWSGAIGARLDELGWTLGAVEIGTGGSLGALLGDAHWFRFDESMEPDTPAATAHAAPGEGAPRNAAGEDPEEPAAIRPEGDDAGDGAESADGDLLRFARRARELGGAQAGIAVRARPRAGDTAVSMAISTPAGEHVTRRLVFMTGSIGRSRAALTAAAFLLETLRKVDRAADR